LPVIVIGGGLAGLSAGVDLAERGCRVTVLEARPHLGGRAYSYIDEATGTVVDNGQHAMMGCYHHTLAFLQRIGAAHKVTRQPNLHVEMRCRDGRQGKIAAGHLPSPLHTASGLLRYGLLSPPARVRALWAGLRLMQMRRLGDARLGHQSCTDLLNNLGQSLDAQRCFWNPLIVATLNELPERAAAAPFVEVLARAFFGSRADSQFVFANVGLSDLYAGDARRFIEARGGVVQTQAAVVELLRTADTVAGVRLRDGRLLNAGAVICAVPPRQASRLLPELGESSFPSTPIVSVHLWLDRAVLGVPFVGLVGATAQWLFNRSALLQQPAGAGQHVSVVISAAHEVVEWENQRLTATVLEDLRLLLPPTRGAQLQRSVVVREKYATLSVTPPVERRRPAPETALRNLFLAGDWVQTGLPATIESAVLSGSRAAVRAAARVAAPASARVG
jgi:squalene-associated FAD-dependent desaturase